MKDCEEYSIGRVAKMLNLPVHTIRFWTEEFTHIECLRRKNRRYYDNKAVEEFREDPKTYTLDEVEKELGL